MKLYILPTLLALAAALTSLNAHAGDDAHGGGVVCITPQKCVTLAEAGLKVKAPETQDDFYVLPKALRAGVHATLDLTGLSDEITSYLAEDAIGNIHTYIPVETVDPKKLEAVRQEYVATISEMFPGFDLKKFEIIAWSDNAGHTYLTPRFFEMPINVQTLTLIHEGNVRRGGPQPLFAALSFDLYLWELTQTPNRINQPNFNLLGLQISLYRLGLYGDSHAISNAALLKLIRKTPRQLYIQDFCSDTVKGAFGCKFDQEKVFAFLDTERAMVPFLEGGNFDVRIYDYPLTHDVDVKKPTNNPVIAAALEACRVSTDLDKAPIVANDKFSGHDVVLWAVDCTKYKDPTRPMILLARMNKLGSYENEKYLFKFSP